MSTRKQNAGGPIVVYGATGYTGKLVAAELRRREFEFVLAGRSSEKLKRVASDLRLDDVELVQASIGNPDSLRSLLEDAAVVINCAGPFTHIGEPVIKAAIETGTHYLDTTGEQGFMKMVVDRYDQPAQSAGVAVVCGMGFDYVPGDCAARIAAEGLEPLDQIEINYSVDGISASRGTMLSALEVIAGNDLIYRSGRWRSAPRSLEPTVVEFPRPLGSQHCLRFSSGEVVSVPRHTQVRELAVRINTRSIAPKPVPPAAVSYLMPVLALAIKTPLRRALGKLIARAPEGPSARSRKASTFTIYCKASGSGGTRSVVVHGADPYGLTAVTTVQGAYLQSLPGYDRSGALSSASAFDPHAFFTYLEDFGISLSGRWKETG